MYCEIKKKKTRRNTTLNIVSTYIEYRIALGENDYTRAINKIGTF